MTAATRPLAGAARFVPVPVGEPWIEPPEEITWTGRAVGGRYTVCERIGGGGMADVYRVRDERLQQEVALKVLRGSLASHELRARMLQEARAAAAIEHPHMLRVLDVGEELGTTYIAMELLRGGPLSRLLHDAGGRLPWRKVVPLLLPGAAALQHAHDCGYVHRDIKPDNLWVAERDGTPSIVVLDLGIARADRARRGVDSPPTTELGRALGTPRYMSPEQAAGQAVDARSDVYSFGVTLYRALTGGFPWTTGSDGAVVEPRAALQAPELELPPALVDAIARALARRPEERLPSMRAFASLLRSAIAAPSRRGGPSMSWMITGALGGAMTMAGVHAWMREERTIEPVAVSPAADCEQVIAAIEEGAPALECAQEPAPTVIAVSEPAPAGAPLVARPGGSNEAAQAGESFVGRPGGPNEAAQAGESLVTRSGGPNEAAQAGESLVTRSGGPNEAAQAGEPLVTRPGSSASEAARAGAPPARAPNLLTLAESRLRGCYDDFGGAEAVEFRVRVVAVGERVVELGLTPGGSPLARCVRTSFAELNLPPRTGRWMFRRGFTIGPGGVR